MIKTFSPINTFLLLIILAISVFGLVTIPADQLVAVHWNINGEVDFELPANLALWIGPLECLVVILSVYFAHKNMPTEEFAAAKSLLEASVSIAFGAGLLVQSVITLSASGYVLDVPQIATIFIGFVMLILGNYLPKSQANRAAGIRLPWTMRSETVWTKTHHFAGKCFMAAGMVILLAGVINFAAPVILIIALATVLLCVGLVGFYSYSIRELT